MLRTHLQSNGSEAGFHWRGAEVSRLEGFADAVFAFAITLLVVSLEVPKTFPELFAVMRGFFAFGLCFAQLAYVWWEHYRFFRRYALQDTAAVVLNCALLFFVLFYVYPLKFIFSAIFDRQDMMPSEWRTLITIWGLGYTAVFGVFTLLYVQAWRSRTLLALTPVEVVRTGVGLQDHFGMALIGLLSASLSRALPDSDVAAAIYAYLLIPIYFTISHRLGARRERRIAALQPPG